MDTLPDFLGRMWSDSIFSFKLKKVFINTIYEPMDYSEVSRNMGEFVIESKHN